MPLPRASVCTAAASSFASSSCAQNFLGRSGFLNAHFLAAACLLSPPRLRFCRLFRRPRRRLLRRTLAPFPSRCPRATSRCLCPRSTANRASARRLRTSRSACSITLATRSSASGSAFCRSVAAVPLPLHPPASSSPSPIASPSFIPLPAPAISAMSALRTLPCIASSMLVCRPLFSRPCRSSAVAAASFRFSSRRARRRTRSISRRVASCSASRSSCSPSRGGSAPTVPHAARPPRPCLRARATVLAPALRASQLISLIQSDLYPLADGGWGRAAGPRAIFF